MFAKFMFKVCLKLLFVFLLLQYIPKAKADNIDFISVSFKNEMPLSLFEIKKQQGEKDYCIYHQNRILITKNEEEKQLGFQYDKDFNSPYMKSILFKLDNDDVRFHMRNVYTHIIAIFYGHDGLWTGSKIWYQYQDNQAQTLYSVPKGTKYVLEIATENMPFFNLYKNVPKNLKQIRCFKNQ